MLTKEIVAPGKGAACGKQSQSGFVRRTPFWNYGLIQYQPDLDIKEIIDEALDNLLEGDIDSGNGDILDCFIFDFVRRLRVALLQESIVHQDSIADVGLRASGDVRAFELNLECLREELEENLREQRSIEERIRSTKFKEVQQHE